MELNGNFVYTDAVIKLMQDAEAAGFEVTTLDTQIVIVKRHRGHGRILKGVRIFIDVRLDGTSRFYSAYRLDVDPSLALNIRTIKLVRKVLDLS
jgi:hypothetical protein